MKTTKRLVLFLITNLVVVATISFASWILGLQTYLAAQGINYQSLIAFCVLWGFGGAFFSLAMSRVLAKWMMGVKLIDPTTSDYRLRIIVQKVHGLATKAGLKAMPQVGIYEGSEINAFATGPTHSHSLVAVSTGLLQKMSEDELEGVLAHEIAHIANGDMVTMTLMQGVVNAFVMFLARVIGFFASQFVSEDKRSIVHFGIVFIVEIILGFLGMIVVASFSRHREYRADRGGAILATREQMIASLEKLKSDAPISQSAEQRGFEALKISSMPGKFFKLLATHPELNDRVKRLKQHDDHIKIANSFKFESAL